MSSPRLEPSREEPRSAGADDEDGPGAKPFVKWAGGKWSLAPAIAGLFPRDLARRTYREPFVGGGAMFFWLRRNMPAERYVLSDALRDLVHTYRVVKNDPDELIGHLKRLAREHARDAEKTFYEVRERYNTGKGAQVARAAWLIYLNKTCFNGLYRTNRKGHFNVPIGRFVRPNIADEPRLRAASEALRGVDVYRAPFDDLLLQVAEGDVVYLDPPYVPVSRTSNFDAYAGGAFGLELQTKLRDVYRELDQKGCLLILSNSDAPEVRELYAEFDIETISAARSISSKGATRGAVNEVVVRNVQRWPASARSRVGR